MGLDHLPLKTSVVVKAEELRTGLRCSCPKGGFGGHAIQDFLDEAGFPATYTMRSGLHDSLCSLYRDKKKYLAQSVKAHFLVQEFIAYLWDRACVSIGSA